MADGVTDFRNRGDKSTNKDEIDHKLEKTNASPDGHIFGDSNLGFCGGYVPAASNSGGSNKSFHDDPSQQKYQNATEYAQAVQAWIMQYYHSTSMNNFYTCSFPFYCMGYTQAYSAALTAGVGLQQAVGSAQSGQTQNVNVRQQNGMPFHFQYQQQNVGPPREQPPAYRDYRIPPIWKRVVAEFIDFLLLLLIKVGVTCILVDYTGTISDFPPFDLEQMITKGEIDIEKLLSLTSEIVIMEVINRIFISIYEALCLRHGIRTIGGSTPGKRVMGLCVVSCNEAVDLPENKVRVYPAQNIGFWNALVRSVIKNFSLAFLFPMCFTSLFFQHSRAAYDIISNSIVVESNEDLMMLGQRR